MKKVFVTTCNTGYTHKLVSMALLNIQLDARYKLRIMLPTHRPYENNLHHCINDFMNSDEDFWLNIDSDNPPVKNPLDLVELDKDIVGLPTPVWNYSKPGERPIYWNGYKWNEEKQGYNEWPIKKGLQEVDAIGTGCFLISRRVFENPLMRKAPFERICRFDGTVEYGNDLAFCRRALKAGFKIYCHFGYPCNHVVELPLLEVIEAYSSLEEKNG